MRWLGTSAPLDHRAFGVRNVCGRETAIARTGGRPQLRWRIARINATAAEDVARRSLRRQRGDHHVSGEARMIAMSGDATTSTRTRKDPIRKRKNYSGWRRL